MLKYKYRLNSLLSRVKGLFSRRFHYSYSTHSTRYKVRNLVVGNKKQLWTASVVIALIFSFYLVSETMTGYLTYGENMELELNKTRDILLITQDKLKAIQSSEQGCQNNLLVTEGKLNSCNQRLSNSESFLLACESERDNLKTYSEELNTLIDTCETERDELEVKYEDASTSLSNLIGNTVSLICCRPGIEISQWEIVDDEIVCSGPFTVNCTTGEVEY